MQLVGELCRYFCVLSTMVLIQACRTTYSRDTLLAINGQYRCAIDQRVRDVVSHLQLRRRGCRAGQQQRRRVLAAHSVMSAVSQPSIAGEIPTVIGNRGQSNVNTGQLFRGCRDARVRICRTVARKGPDRNYQDARQPREDETVPSLYLLNAAGLAKPHAIEHIAADLTSNGTDVAIITETHFKAKHADGVLNIPGYTLYRRDRVGRRGGGVATYVRSTLQSATWKPGADDKTYELQWTKVGSDFVGALYHPPKPLYSVESLLNHIEANVNEINQTFQHSKITLAGDFNQLSDAEVIERTGLTSIVHQPTRGANTLDRIYVSHPCYSSVRVVSSVVRSDHKVVVAYTDNNKSAGPKKTSTQLVFRTKAPEQHALFLQTASDINFDFIQTEDDVQTQFDTFYNVALQLLDYFYPQHLITVTNRDPYYITPKIKSLLRRKNKLMRKGRLEEASALARRIGKTITKCTKTQLSTIGENTDSKKLWSCVRNLTGKTSNIKQVKGITADSLNDHYANMSTDLAYCQPLLKNSAFNNTDSISEWSVFKVLDTLRPTSTGLDNLPAWFLRLGAPIFYKPLTYLFNLSLSNSVVPIQWKLAWIRPIPKVSAPAQHSDYRPISITPVLTRILERIVVRQYIYPAILKPPPALSFSDQFAYRPTGSTTAAIITILHTVTELLASNPYVIVIAIDFSKAFDTVRHKTLLDKMSQLDIPDNIFNWLVDFLAGHSHQTHYGDSVSQIKSITASIIQGSAIGPTSYVVTASDLHTVSDGNQLCKYADDTYLIIPAVNVNTRSNELQHISDWAASNNLSLNLSKSEEIVFVDKRKKHKFNIPDTLDGLKRVQNIKILGVTFTNGLSVTPHVQHLATSNAQILYALKILRAHGLCRMAIQAVFRSVILARFLYASPAWWGFAGAQDRQKVYGFLRRSARVGFYSSDSSSFDDLCIQADQNLFNKVLHNPDHVLHRLLPPVAYTSYYCLRPRAHDRSLPERLTHLTDCNFIIRMLFYQVY